jgi:hypothetical protein
MKKLSRHRSMSNQLTEANIEGQEEQTYPLCRARASMLPGKSCGRRLIFIRLIADDSPQKENMPLAWNFPACEIVTICQSLFEGTQSPAIAHPQNIPFGLCRARGHIIQWERSHHTTSSACLSWSRSYLLAVLLRFALPKPQKGACPSRPLRMATRVMSHSLV